MNIFFTYIMNNLLMSRVSSAVYVINLQIKIFCNK